MTDQPDPCRTTRHCADHGFCHRCMPSLDDAVRHLVKAMKAAGIEYPASSDVYARLAATVRDAARQAAGQPSLPRRDATVDPAVCPRCKGDNQDAFELCATCAAAAPSCTCIHPPEEDAGQLLHASYCTAAVEETHIVADDSDDPEHVDDCPGCEPAADHDEHCPTPETHNWGCGCPTDKWPAADARSSIAAHMGTQGNDPTLALLLNRYHEAVARQAVAEHTAAAGQPATQQQTKPGTARARLAALIGYEPDEHDAEFEKRVDAVIAESLHEAARRMEGAGYDDDAVAFLDLLAARQTADEAAR